MTNAEKAIDEILNGETSFVSPNRKGKSVIDDMLKSNWVMPDAPKGFNIPVAFIYNNETIELDWTRIPQRDFASEYGEVNIDYPFKSEIKPNALIWKILGFLEITE